MAVEKWTRLAITFEPKTRQKAIHKVEDFIIALYLLKLLVVYLFLHLITFSEVATTVATAGVVVVELSTGSTLHEGTIRTSDVGSELAAIFFRNIEFNILIFSKRSESWSMDDRLVNKDIITTVGRGDESEALGRIEELDLATDLHFKSWDSHSVKESTKNPFSI